VFTKNLVDLATSFAASADGRFEFQKRGQLFIHAGNVIETHEHTGDFKEW
jgi:hypothetical protein